MTKRSIVEGDILYVVLIDEYEENLPFIWPQNLDIRALQSLRFLPKNLVQFKSPIDYLTATINASEFSPYKIFFNRRKDEKSLMKFLADSAGLKIVLLDSEKDAGIFEKLETNKTNLIKVLDYSDKADAANTIKGILNYLMEYVDDLLDLLKIKYPFKDHLSVNLDVASDKDYNYFTPTANNYLIYNNSIGNFSFHGHDDSERISEESAKALKTPYSFFRLNSHLSQLRSFDDLTKKLAVNFTSLAYGFNHYPLFVCFPFHNPDLLDFFQHKKDDKEFKQTISMLGTEQTSNYVNILAFDDKRDKDFIRHATEVTSSYLHMKSRGLDSIGFLLASFQFSPYVRFPTLGKSVYRELSFMAPKNFHRFLHFKSRLNISDTLLKVGEKMCDGVLSSEFKKYLAGRNSQVVAISDLPVEWMDINGVPFCFTHDITRLPETSAYNLLNSFATNIFFDFTVPADIINDTLVIIGTDDDNFKRWHKHLFDLSEKKGFKIRTCLSNQAFKDAIEEVNPKFLIIDSHGGFDKETKTTYVEMGSDQLTGKFIAENVISIPLVFISACGTAPVYGTFDPLANSFLAMGAKSVTSTFLPVDVDSSTMVYFTILNNLDKVSGKGSFNNWLEYMCYSIRSSFLHQTFVPLVEDGNGHEKTYHDLTNKILYFKERRKIFEQVRKLHHSLPQKKLNSIKANAFEFLYYTNIGRGDLVLFDTYKQRGGSQLLKEE